MKAAPFAVVAPTTVAEAVACLVGAAGSVRLLAGGQSLLPLMAARAVRPDVVVDLGRVVGLDGIRVDGGDLVIGAMARQRVVERHPLVAVHAPLLARAIPHIAHVTVRNQGTVGGSIANADPTAELPVVAVALGASMVVVGPHGERRIPASRFFVGPLRTSMAVDELLTEIRFPVAPAPPERIGAAFAEVSRRPGDVALASAAVMVHLDDSGRVTHLGSALGSVGPTPMQATTAAAVLVGSLPTTDVIAAAVVAASAGLSPRDDLHASAAYRRHVVGVLLRRALTAACSEAAS